jgi:DNA polymerase III subunit delta'
MSPVVILHPHTKQHVAQFVAQPMHAVLLIGSNGIGKTTIAEQIITEVLAIEAAKLANYPYISRVQPEKNSISIEAIRELQRFLQLKTIGQKPLRRAVIVEHAEALTTEAQNAFLKLLEEPPTDTIIILTADNQRALLPTILSRVQSIPIAAPEEQHLKQHFAEQGKEAGAITQAYFMSGGLPGLMSALLNDDETHPLMAGVAQAKEILQKQTFERLAMVESFSKQKDQALFMLEALQHIAQTGLNQAVAQAATPAAPAKVKQWHHILKVTTQAIDALNQNANAKLTLSNLMLQL